MCWTSLVVDVSANRLNDDMISKGLFFANNNENRWQDVCGISVILENGEEYIASQSLSYYDELLPKQIFCRIHKSHIINLEKVDQIEKGRGGNVIMNNGKSYKIAQRRKAVFMSYLRK